jgi:1,2-phenylacetyl-CoA epoxidase catalytic subunit
MVFNPNPSFSTVIVNSFFYDGIRGVSQARLVLSSVDPFSMFFTVLILDVLTLTNG